MLVLICLAFYDSGATDPLHALILPLVMACGAWLLVQNPAAVALGVAVLAAIHADLNAVSWIERVAYPLVALAASTLLALIGARRFARRIADTHEVRWSGRRPS
jgi:hypothetical protein